MAFGMMTNKFGLLQRPYSGDVRNVDALIKAIGRVHNFIINERLKAAGGNGLINSADEMLFHIPSTPHTAAGVPVDCARLDCANDPGIHRMENSFSMMRLNMVERVRHLNLKRPTHSDKRQKKK